MGTDTSKVITVMSFNTVMEAQLYKALLESAGVQARMQNDLAAQVMPAYGALMQVNLLVAEEDQKKAREILGAKFDIDDFHRQTAGPAKKPAVKKAAVKKAAKESPAKKTAAKKAPAKETEKKPAVKKAATTKAAAKTTAKPTAKKVAEKGAESKKPGRPKKTAAK